MDLIRRIFDGSYDFGKRFLLDETREDPEVAHELFVKFSKIVSKFHLERLLLNNKTNYIKPITRIPILNAAGFNKNADIPINFLKHLGFDFVVIGSVSYDKWDGNERPRIKRFPRTDSMVNWMGLPGIGALKVRENIEKQKYDSDVIINFISTPGKQGDEMIRDLENTVRTFVGLKGLKRYELNISCPNTKEDFRNFQGHLKNMVKMFVDTTDSRYELDYKLSPDSSEDELEALLEVTEKYGVTRGYVCGNTSKYHDPKYIDNNLGKGGASGNAVFDISLDFQKMVRDKLIKRRSYSKIIACGGIDSKKKLRERIDYGASEAQLFTGLIYKGPRLIRELKS